MIQHAIAKVVNGTDLTESEMTQAMEAVTDGDATPAQIAAFLIGLRTKGEAVDEIVAAAEVIRKKITRLPIGSSDVCLDRDEINVDLETVASTRTLPGREDHDLQRLHHNRFCGGWSRLASGKARASLRVHPFSGALTCSRPSTFR